MSKLDELVKYLKDKGFTVSFVGNKVLHDYAAMNPAFGQATNWPIGKREFQVDKNLSLEKQTDDLRHEIIEYNLMRAGVPYAGAHITALQLEKSPLGTKEIDKLASMGRYSVVHVHDDGDLTIEHDGANYVLTTEGQSFKEESKKMTNDNEKFFHPKTTNTGWHKNMPEKLRRSMMLKAHGNDNLATARALQELANVTTDEETKQAASKDAQYFYTMHSQQQRQVARISQRTPRISQRTPRLE